MIEKGTIQQAKKILGYVIGIIGVSLIFKKEETLSFVANTGFFMGNFYVSSLSILLIVTSYFFVIAGRRN